MQAPIEMSGAVRNFIAARATAALLQVIVLATVSLCVNSQSLEPINVDPIGINTPFQTPMDSPGLSGLQDKPSIGNAPVSVGHFLTGDGLKASTAYSAGIQHGGIKLPDNTMGGSWSQSITYSSAASGGVGDVAEMGGRYPGVSMSSAAVMPENNVWLMDANNTLAYKLDAESCATGNATITGVYETRPSGTTPPPPYALSFPALISSFPMCYRLPDCQISAIACACVCVCGCALAWNIPDTNNCS